MGVLKRRPQPKPTKPPRLDRAIQWQVDRMKRQHRTRNHDAVIKLAQSLGADVADAIELYEERAGVREYDANDSREHAEGGALRDVRDILAARSRRCAND